MRHALLFTALVSGLLQVASPDVHAQSLSSAPPESVGLSGERLTQIGKVFGAEVDQGRLPGAVIAVARRGKLVYFEALGYQDKPADKKIRALLKDDQTKKLDQYLAGPHDEMHGGLSGATAPPQR